jgi:hypothetical protein
MSMDAVKASASDKKREHEARLQRQILDWVEVVKPVRGDILVLRVPDEKFIHPGTKREDVTEEQEVTMQVCHQVLGTLIQSVQQAGVLPGGAAILAESMKLEDLPPPWEKHPDTETHAIEVPRSRILLPPGTKI